MNKRMTLIITFYAVYFILWAIVGLAGNTILGYAAAAIIGSLLLIFCLFGWCTLSAIQPAMFIWLAYIKCDSTGNVYFDSAYGMDNLLFC